jgi:hypothetical protein
LVSLFLVSTLVSLFLVYRLFLHIRANVSQPSGEITLDSQSVMTGLRGWLVETEARAGFSSLSKGSIFRSEKVDVSDNDAVDEKEGLSNNDTQLMNEKSGFVIDDKSLLTGLGQRGFGKQVE